MSSSSPHLLKPFESDGLSMQNRVVMAPLTRARSGPDRIPNDLMREYYTQRASAGLIIAEATTVSPQGNGWNESPGVYTDEMEAGWKKIVESVHEAKGKIFLQLWHTGRASHSSFHDGNPAVAPSAIGIQGDHIYTPKGKEDYETPRALETSEIAGVVADYRAAAVRAKAAGFDGVEIHSANGYLLDSFMQSKTNHREDQYGGSIEARFQMLKEVVEAVTEVMPANQVGVRFSPNGVFNDMGSPDYREQFTYAAKQLDAYGLAYLHVMDGLGFGFHELGEAMTLSDFRKVFSGPLMGNCGYDQASAEEAVASGNADMIAIGRPYISNPDLVARYANDWALNPEAEMEYWYTPGGAKGYTDFPTHEESTN